MEEGERAADGVAEPPLDVVEDGNCARAFYSHDFEWETLRAEIEDSAPELCEPVDHRGATVSEGHSKTTPLAASRAWDVFHKIHSKGLFFKERRYLLKEFPELLSAGPRTRILEAGCGTGSTVVPILRGNKYVNVYGCDCSNAALEKAADVVSNQACLTKSQIQSFHAFLCDISSEDIPSWLCCTPCRMAFKQLHIQNQERSNDSASAAERKSGLVQHEHCCVGGVSIVTLIFTLSALPLESMNHALTELVAVMEPGGWLLFRDYGLYDMTMLRFPRSQMISHRLYQRKDGTLSYFFTLEDVRHLFTMAGLVEEELYYCCVELMNRKKQVPMKRVWIHAKFRKVKCGH